MPPRCFLGCPNELAVHLHVFPSPERLPEQFKKWVEVVGGQLNSPEDYEFFKMKRLCDRHFIQEHKNRNNRLNALAVPSLFLRAEPADNLKITVKLTEISMENPLLQTTSLSTSLKELSTSEVSLKLPETILNIPLLQIQAGNETVTESSTATCSKTVVNVPVLHSQPCLDTTCFTEDNPALQIFATQNASKGINTSACDLGALAAASSEIARGGPVDHDAEGKTSNSNFCSKYTTRRSSTDPNVSIYLEHNYSKFPPKNAALRLRPSYSVSKYRMEQRHINNLKQRINSLRKRCTSFKNRLASATKISVETAFQKVTKNMKSPAKLFTRMQLTQTSKKPSGRRFSLEEKILSLSLYKRSPKCYSLLAHCFTLPSKKTLKAIMAQIKLGPGVNEKIFEKLKKTVSELSTQDRLCSVIFDEMSLTPQITYDITNDKLKGFVSKDINENEDQIANHVLVFMVKGIKASYKQPVAYYFTNSLTKYKLKKLITEVITNVQAAGLIVLCSICDQSTVNVGAITSLVEDSKNTFLRQGKNWRHDFYQINNQKIIPLYDVPHLLKGLRNNLLTKDLLYNDPDDENKEKVVKWKYFQEIYEADKSFGELRLLHKITEEHINADKIKKMRVKTAAQIFSHSVAVVAEHLTARGILNQECRQLIPFVSMIDKLFDSLNSNTFHIPNGKIYKACVKKTSPHHQLWTKAKTMLKSMKFVAKKKTGDKIRLVTTTVPTTHNFVKTIEGFEALWNILSKKYLFDAMLTRNCNQDPVENFFGNIRSYGARNTSPNSVAFEGAFKALLLNNFNSPHSVNANCENDENNCLQSLDFFVNEKKEKIEDKKTEDIPLENIEISEELLEDREMQDDLGQRNYVCGWVITKCLKNIVKGCANCKAKLLCKSDVGSSNDYIKSKEYKKKKRWLTYPSDEAVSFFFEIQKNTIFYLKKNVHQSGLRAKIKWICNTFSNFLIECDVHGEKVKEYFIITTINILINSWCREINRILAGKVTYAGDDEIKNAAQVYFNKHKHFKKGN